MRSKHTCPSTSEAGETQREQTINMDSSMNGGANPPQPENRGGFRRRRRRRGGKGQQGHSQNQPQGASQGQGQPNGGPRRQQQNGMNGQPRHQNKGGGQQNRRNRNRRGGGPAFFGPMDHSYRASGNGNMNDNRGNLVQNARYRGRGTPNGSPPEVEFAPLPFREDAPTRIFFFVDD